MYSHEFLTSTTIRYFAHLNFLLSFIFKLCNHNNRLLLQGKGNVLLETAIYMSSFD